MTAEPPARTPSTPGVTTNAAGDYLSHRQILVVMGGLMAGMFLAALDQSIVAVALPMITSELGGLDQLSWLVTAYLLTATAATPFILPKARKMSMQVAMLQHWKTFNPPCSVFRPPLA